MKSILLFVAIFGAAVALPSKFDARFSQEALGRNSALEQMVLDLLEDLRQTMITGSDDIPVLDPLEITNVDVKGEDLGFPGSHALLSDVIVSKLSTFVVDTLDISLTSLFPLQLYTLTFDARIPSLEADAREYDLMLRAMGITIFGSGKASVALIEPRISGSVVLRFQIFGMQVTVQSANVKVQLTGFQSNISGIFNDAAMSLFANSFIEYLVPNAVLVYEEEISTLLNNLIPEIANDILENIDLGSILGRV